MLQSAYEKYLKDAKRLGVPEKEIFKTEHAFNTARVGRNKEKLSPHEVALRQTQGELTNKQVNARYRAAKGEIWDNIVRELGLTGDDAKYSRKNFVKAGAYAQVDTLASTRYAQLKEIYATELAAGTMTTTDLAHIISVEVYGSPD